ncbi:MAG: trimethylamine methyltransferase family protein [Planctomycetota bacterium]|nr:trimethylamine methyltransferase family protein [Planctomycetota bacterium]
MHSDSQGAATPPASFRPGVVVRPATRFTDAQLGLLHDGSLQILQDPGILCFNEEAVSVYAGAGCATERAPDAEAWIVRVPPPVIEEAIEAAPSRVVLGAREPANALVVDAHVPRVYFGTGSETNTVLEIEVGDAAPAGDEHRAALRYTHHRGAIRHLLDSARLCNTLNNVDFFIRNVNIQDEDIDDSNKDVNVFLACLMYMTKHVQAGLTSLDALEHVVRLGEIVAGGADAFRAAPPLSFIACPVKSPLQMVDDTTSKVMRIAERGIPLVLSSSPQGGSTAPVQEEGMLMQINAELLAAIALTQLVRPGTPVLYGGVPVRARLDTLHDLYGAPEFIQYHVGCAQLARRYGLPCYSSAGVGDSAVPGVQATVEKIFSQFAVAQCGAPYIHYAFGLLDRTGTWCPAQAVIDNANIEVVKGILRPTKFEEADVQNAIGDVRKVMGSGTRLYARLIRKQIRRGVVANPYMLESEGDHDRVLERACDRLAELRAAPGEALPRQVIESIRAEVPGLVPPERFVL